MIIKDKPSVIEAQYQETYASASRTSEAIQHDLEAVIDDFSLADETIGDFEFTDWIN